MGGQSSDFLEEEQLQASNYAKCQEPTATVTDVMAISTPQYPLASYAP